VKANIQVSELDTAL